MAFLTGNCPLLRTTPLSLPVCPSAGYICTPCIELLLYPTQEGFPPPWASFRSPISPEPTCCICILQLHNIISHLFIGMAGQAMPDHLHVPNIREKLPPPLFPAPVCRCSDLAHIRICTFSALKRTCSLRDYNCIPYMRQYGRRRLQTRAATHLFRICLWHKSIQLP